MSWLQLAGSVAAILMLAGVARLLGLGPKPVLADDDAAVAEAETVSGFAARQVWRSRDGSGAAVLGRDDSIVLIRRHGAHWLARRFVAPLSAEVLEDLVTLRSHDRTFGDLPLSLDPFAAEELMRRIGSGPQRPVLRVVN